MEEWQRRKGFREGSVKWVLEHERGKRVVVVVVVAIEVVNLGKEEEEESEWMKGSASEGVEGVSPHNNNYNNSIDNETTPKCVYVLWPHF